MYNKCKNIADLNDGELSQRSSRLRLSSDQENLDDILRPLGD